MRCPDVCPWWRSVLFTLAVFSAALLPLPGAATEAAPSVPGAPVGPPASRTIDSGWQLRLAPGDAHAAEHPDAAAWLPATVPGSVQTDLMAAGLLPDPWVGDNEAAVQWVGLADWQYRTTVDVDAATLARSGVDLVFDGLDTLATVRVNDVAALSADNMFRTWRIPAKGLLHAGRNTIEVDLASPIKALQPKVLAMPHPLPGSYDSAFGDEPPAKQTANYVRKANYQYGWDWAPRVVTLGIWQPVRIEADDGVRLADLHVAQQHVDADMAVLDAQVELVADRIRTVDVRVDLAAPDGATQTQRRRVVLHGGVNTVALPLHVDHPQRWWPAGYGRPDRYTVRAQVDEAGRSVGRAEHRIGLRTTELRREQDQWGRSHALVVNGVPIFAKGANLVPFDSIPSRVPLARMQSVLRDAAAANMNVLRVWGGGYYLPDAFYEEADRLGLMLTQDFMFGGAIPPGDAAFRETTRLEAVEQVRRLRDHPSLVLWTGNNEVQASWEEWDDRLAYKQTLTGDEQEAIAAGMVRLFDQVLRGAVALNAPQTPYIAGSPSTDYDGPADQMTDGDVHYWKVWVGAPLEDYLTTTPRYMSEFGLQSMPSLQTLRRVVDPAVLAATPVELVGNGYDHGNGNGRLLGHIRANYGEPASFADYVYLSQVLQAEGVEMAVLHLRAHRPQSMGALYWTLNDAWPGPVNRNWTGAAWGSVDFDGHWKALHHHARRFYAPVALGAERSEGVTALTAINDRQVPLAARWRLRVIDRDGAVRSDRGGEVTAAPLAATPLATYGDAELLADADPARTVALAELTVDGAVASRRIVYFAEAKELALVDPELHWQVAAAAPGRYTLTLTGRSLARAVWIDTGDLAAALSDNAFDLAPGETATVTLTTDASLADVQRVLTVRSLYGAARAETAETATTAATDVRMPGMGAAPLAAPAATVTPP